MWNFLILLIIRFNLFHCDRDTVSLVDNTKYSVARDVRFLIYDVNHGEGFNLRRDVYMRIANAVRLLREAGEPFVLVLPPWGGLYHWQRQQVKLNWSLFFDVESMHEFVPVMEFETFVQEQGNTIDQVVYLQPYKEGWSNEFVLKYDHRDCIDGQRFYKFENDAWRGWFFSYDIVRAVKFECLSVQGDSNTLKKIILEEYPDRRSIFIDRAETVLHQHYGDVRYWEARRSMRYAKYLVEAGNLFRMTQLSSTDEKDRTKLPASFRNEHQRRDALGGDYICAHWRRRDFLRAHGKELPSIKETARKLNELCTETGVSQVFLATDAPDSEVEQLSLLLHFPLLRYTNDELLDGAVAIVDQWICSHARYFIGSHSSTFSFRIQEDREILGFLPNTTFNRFCPDGVPDCEQPAKWTIVYE